MRKILKKKNLAPWDPPGVPGVTISGPNRGIFSKLNGPGPLGSEGHSHTSFSHGRFRVAQRTLQYDVTVKWKLFKRLNYGLRTTVPCQKSYPKFNGQSMATWTSSKMVKFRYVFVFRECGL